MWKKSKAEQEETLNKIVRVDGVGEDPAVRAVLSDEFVNASNVDAAQIAMILQEIVRGNKLMSDQIALVNERMDKMDAEAKAREAEQKKFVEGVLDRAESLKATGEERDKIIAKGVKMAESAMQDAAAKLASDNLRFDEELKNMPKELVVSPGELISVLENGQQVSRLIPEEIRIRNKRWLLPPGQSVMVPKAVADRVRLKRRSEEETRARKQALSENLEADKLSKRWQEINGTYGSKAEAMPTV